MYWRGLEMHVFRRCVKYAVGYSRLWLLCICWVFGVHSATNFDQLQAAFSQRWGSAGMLRFTAWRELIASGAGNNDLERLKRVNEFVNRTTVFGEDIQIWGQTDYWATPLETLGRGAGDCEDFVIMKYYTLQMVGVAADKLRLTYVRARTGASSGTPTQAHMVLAYYALPDDEPLVLDNLIGDVRTASRRPDLFPVFSFNSQVIYAGASGKEIAPAVGAGRLSRWEDLLKRVRAEGFQ